MNVSDFQPMLDNFEKKVNDVAKAAENLSEVEIVIDDTNSEGAKKFEEVKNKLDKTIDSMETRLRGMKNKVVGGLHEVYKKASGSLEPYKTIAETILEITSPGADLGKLATFADQVIDVLTAIANHYTSQYTEPMQTIAAITSASELLASSMSKLSSLPLPRVRTKSGKSYMPKAITCPTITLQDIINGTKEDESSDESL